MESRANKFNLPGWFRIILLGRRPKYTLIRAAVIVVVSLVVFPFILRPVRVVGASMEPTCHDGSIKFVNRLAYTRREPKRGDVVAIRFSPGGNSVMLMKRIVGLPGETIGFSRGRLFINGEPLPEPYVKYSYRWSHRPEKLGPDEFFVVGDNRANSESGKTERWRIVGKVIL